MPECARVSGDRDEILRYADVEFDIGRLKVWRNGRFIRLSTMQMRLLRHLLENPEVVFSRQQLIDAVWGGEKLTEGAVTACISRIRSALDAPGGPTLIRSISGVGYALDIEADRPQSPARASRAPVASQSRHSGETAVS